MACNCKKKIDLEDKYGVEEEENLFQFAFRMIYKVFLFIVALIVTAVFAPIALLYALFKLFFGDGNIVLPKKLVTNLTNILNKDE